MKPNFDSSGVLKFGLYRKDDTAMMSFKSDFTQELIARSTYQALVNRNTIIAPSYQCEISRSDARSARNQSMF